MERIKATVDLNVICNNLLNTTKHIPDKVKRIAVVKADAYGHGAVAVSKHLQKTMNVDAFAVATLEEGMELRKNGIGGMILVLGYIEPEKAKIAENDNITVSVGTYDYAEKLFSYGSPEAHLQIDTGMSRMGVYCHKNDDIATALEEIKKICVISKNKIKGIYTHFAMSDDPTSNMTHIQYESFNSLINACQNSGITFETKHCCNSMGTVNFSEFALDAVRIGISLYGYEAKCVTPAMTFKTKIIKIFEGKKGDTISYFGTHILQRDTKIAVCGAGYADGVSRQLSNKGHFLVNGLPAPILGRVCMDLTMIDVSKIDCRVGDEALIFGKELPASDVASLCGTISYETLCNVSKRVPREYI